MTQATSSGGKGDADRRDFLIVAASAFGAVGTAAALWPFVDSFNPTADVLALSGTEVDLSAVAVGQADRKSTRLNSSHIQKSRMPSSA